MGKMISLEFQNGPFEAYLTKPAAKTKAGLILIHEVWGLVDHTKDVAERFTSEGYAVLAPDLLSGQPIDSVELQSLQQDLFNPATKSETQPRLRQLTAPIHTPEFGALTVRKLKACFDFLASHADVGGNVAVVGFCFGGTYSFSLSAAEPRLKAAVPFYGHADFSTEELERIACPILAFYGKKDENLMAGLPKLKDDMRSAGVSFTAQVYPACGHAFFNDTNPYTYNAEAAADAWAKTLEFLAANITHQAGPSSYTANVLQ